MRNVLNSSVVWVLTTEGERLYQRGISRRKQESFRVSRDGHSSLSGILTTFRVFRHLLAEPSKFNQSEVLRKDPKWVPHTQFRPNQVFYATSLVLLGAKAKFL